MTRSTTLRVVSLCIVAAVGASPVHAQHQGDVWIGVDSNGVLAVSPRGYVPDDNYAYLVSGGLLPGWSDTSPGFDSITDEDPEYGLFPLESGAEIWLEVVGCDPALQIVVFGNPVDFVHEPGDSAHLGGYTLHRHLPWHINSDDPLYEPYQCVWHGTFVLRDEGDTGYLSSEPMTFAFTNVEMRYTQNPIPAATGDFNEDSVVDADDYTAFAECLWGPGEVPSPDDPAVTTCEIECLNAFDFNNDKDIDLADFALFGIAHGV